MKTTLIWMILMLILGVSAGCAERFIPNTEVPDNDDNREIIDFCERYRKAVEEQNIGLLLSMASPRYYDNSGTTYGDDDYDRSGLETVLRDRFSAIEKIRYEFKYRDIYELDGLMNVDYTYTMSFRFEVDGVSKWANRTADNRLELERVDGGFLIVSGM